MIRTVQVIGLILFCVILAATIMFTQGYQYDKGTNEIIKKGVIYFNSPFELIKGQKRIIRIDGVITDVSFPGGARVIPGTHDLEIEVNGYFPWKKRVQVTEDEVLSFPEIRLLPEKLVVAEKLDGIGDFAIKSVTDDAIVLENWKMNFEKKYYLRPNIKFEINETFAVDAPIIESDEQKMNIEKIELDKRIIEKNAIVWGSRIGESFNAIFLNKDKFLSYCDIDYDNCHELFKLDYYFIKPSKNQMTFFAVKDGNYVLFDFSDYKKSFPDILGKLISGVFRPALVSY